MQKNQRKFIKKNQSTQHNTEKLELRNNPMVMVINICTFKQVEMVDSSQVTIHGHINNAIYQIKPELCALFALVNSYSVLTKDEYD